MVGALSLAAIIIGLGFVFDGNVPPWGWVSLFGGLMGLAVCGALDWFLLR